MNVSARWLTLREPADAAARAADLVGRLPAGAPWTVHDLGAGSGAMGRWLAPLLSGPQHWVLHDRDEHLLALAAERGPGAAADGAKVTVETRRSDITRLRPSDLAGASLITASALLDVLSEQEMAGLAALCAAAQCPALLALSVAGRVELRPAEALDRRVEAAFNAHQRRTTDRGRLLGPDATAAAVEQFRRLGAETLVRPSPWRLGPAEAELAVEWLGGWIGAACEQEPELARAAHAYRRRRLAQARAGELAVTVEHADLLVLPSYDRDAGPPLGQSVSNRGESA